MASYRGTMPFAFFSYSHENRDAIVEIANQMIKEHYRIWYDKAIPVSDYFEDDIANAIKACDVFIIFLSYSYLQKPFCNKELRYAMEEEKKIVVVHLEEISKEKINPNFALNIGGYNAILKYIYKDDSSDDFYTLLFRTNPLLEDCLAKSEEEIAGLLGQEIITVDPIPSNPLLYILPPILLMSMFIALYAQSISIDLRENWILTLLIFVMAVIGAVFMYIDSKKYIVRLSRTTAPSFLSMILSSIGFSNIFLRIATGDILHQIICGILGNFACLVYLVAVSCFYNNKEDAFGIRTLPNKCVTIPTYLIIHTIMTILMCIWYDPDYLFAASTSFLSLALVAAFGIIDFTEYESAASMQYSKAKKIGFGSAIGIFLLVSFAVFILALKQA